MRSLSLAPQSIWSTTNAIDIAATGHSASTGYQHSSRSKTVGTVAFGAVFDSHELVGRTECGASRDGH